MYERILVGTDGSEAANRAIAHALEQAERHDATLHGIFVVDTSRYDEPALSSEELVTDDIEDKGREYLEALEQQARDLDIEFVRRSCHGRPHEEIISYADDIDADLIVLGYQGQSHTQTDTIGSVTERVVRSGVRPTFVA
ncbi:universal stress protein [Natronomonas gomsonensis]|uniref:universal stress protein n=1 Tax=Natronomonas gomsonensis TaxID=1046043 RepID=UPI0015BA2C49|nr:universal stress protein [Natronomonas gomsonensis]